MSEKCDEGKSSSAKSIGFMREAKRDVSCFLRSDNGRDSDSLNEPEHCRISEVTYAPDSRVFPISNARDLI